MKIHPENKELVEFCRKEIIKLSKAQSAVYNQMTEIVGNDDDYLWDYCFNCEEEDEYTQRIRKEIYG